MARAYASVPGTDIVLVDSSVYRFELVQERPRVDIRAFGILGIQRFR